MALIGLTSAHSSPGVSSLALGISQAWAMSMVDQLLIDGDPSGGVLSRRFNLDSSQKTIQDIAPSLSDAEDRVLMSYFTGVEGVQALVGVVGHEDAHWSVERAGRGLCARFKAMELPTAVDLGRLHVGNPWIPSLDLFDSIVLVVRALPEELASAVSMGNWLDDRVSDLRIALVSPSERSRLFRRLSQRFVSRDRARSVLSAVGSASFADIAYQPDNAEFFCGAEFDEAKFRKTRLWDDIALLAESWPASAKAAAGMTAVHDTTGFADGTEETYSGPSWRESPALQDVAASDRPMSSPEPVIRARSVEGVGVHEVTETAFEAEGSQNGSASDESSWFDPGASSSATVPRVVQPEAGPERTHDLDDDGPPPLENPTRS